MQKHRNYFSEEFSLTEVMTLPPAFIYLVAVAGFLVAGLMHIFMLQPLLQCPLIIPYLTPTICHHLAKGGKKVYFSTSDSFYLWPA